MTFKEFINKYNGKKTDYDGVYGVQCVDLIKLYIDKVLGVKPENIGNAIDYYNNRNGKYLTSLFTWHDYTPGMTLQAGDVAVFKTSSKYGHIAICNGIFTAKTFKAYDENYNGTGAGMTLRTFYYGGKRQLLGVLRPKNQKNIQPAQHIKYYPKYNGVTLSIVDALACVGEKDTSYKHRTEIARINGIKMYTGTPGQNLKMLKLLRRGRLISSKK